ncbi:hypothetical protein PAHAL_3G224800 [Panicum hallii]|uniref:BHLH domain-containing protein n=1 Tax=Panicum hallii TaxID=206008 RepID=A0A2S3HAT2_9POAL|nr:transcription factor bHLH123-like isoform X1 [Panicum hallii]PAN18777.1 hypothetical protein PAHAL_3G224800 [Panicum hallii]
MADEWWSSARTGDGASACSTNQDADESAATSATETDYFRPSFHVGAAAAASTPSFLADPAPHMVNWTQAYMSGGRAAGAEATTGFNALLQLHGDDAGRYFLLDQQPDVVDGAEPVAPAAASRSVHLYADNQYSSYGDVPAAPMTKPFSQQQHFSGLFGSSTRNFSDMPSALPMTTKPLLLQAWEHKAFKSNKEPVQDTCSSATRRSVPENSPPAAAKKPRIATPSPLPTFKVCTGRPPACDAIRRDYITFHLQLSGQLLISSSAHAIQVRKEKLGDRITALQQLVSPFGKTDTASVLHEAIEYIRFLHHQVASLSSPYLRCGRPVQQLQQQQIKEGCEAKEDLRSRGLCLVPVASTYAVAASETAPEFWHPTFGGRFR